MSDIPKMIGLLELKESAVAVKQNALEIGGMLKSAGYDWEQSAALIAAILDGIPFVKVLPDGGAETMQMISEKWADVYALLMEELWDE